MASNEVNSNTNCQTSATNEGLIIKNFISILIFRFPDVFNGTDLEKDLLMSTERLDRASPDLWPEQSINFSYNRFENGLIFALFCHQFPEWQSFWQILRHRCSTTTAHLRSGWLIWTRMTSICCTASGVSQLRLSSKKSKNCKTCPISWVWKRPERWREGSSSMFSRLVPNDTNDNSFHLFFRFIKNFIWFYVFFRNILKIL